MTITMQQIAKPVHSLPVLDGRGQIQADIRHEDHGHERRALHAGRQREGRDQIQSCEQHLVESREQDQRPAQVPSGLLDEPRE